MNERFYPKVENLGKECRFWQMLEGDAQQRIGEIATGCVFPKFELQGRQSCEGIVDDVCLYIKDGRTPKSLIEEQIAEIQFKIPDGNNRDLPPGDVS